MAKRAESREVTRLLGELKAGEDGVLGDLFPLIYDELHNLAHVQRLHWVGDHTLNTTALVHEAYIKLVNQAEMKWDNRSHFYGVASKAMRHLLVNYAESRKRQKRGGEVKKVSLESDFMPQDDLFSLADDRLDMLITLNDALKKLATMSERQANIVECRFFGGMSIEETGEALQLSPATVKRGWSVAKTWLFKEMNG